MIAVILLCFGSGALFGFFFAIVIWPKEIRPFKPQAYRRGTFCDNCGKEEVIRKHQDRSVFYKTNASNSLGLTLCFCPECAEGIRRTVESRRLLNFQEQ